MCSSDLMADYVDVFVLPVPRSRLDDYRKLAELGARVWMDAGALTYAEYIADDAKPGKHTSFPQSVDLKDGETVVVSVITYRSRAHRDEVNAKAMADQRLNDCDPKNMPFDGLRMFWGGFAPFVSA